MSGILSASVTALARASLRAYRAAESKCLCATLSALWNLASHSRDNKKAICEESGFLEMLIELLTNDAQQAVNGFFQLQKAFTYGLEVVQKSFSIFAMNVDISPYLG